VIAIGLAKNPAFRSEFQPYFLKEGIENCQIPNAGKREGNERSRQSLFSLGSRLMEAELREKDSRDPLSAFWTQR